MRAPQFTIDDVKYADSPATFGRAQDLFRTGKVQDISETARGYRAIVQGTHPYAVGVSYRRVDEGDCSCYLGQNGRLCKHILSLALAVLHASGKVTPPPQQPPAGLEEIKPLVNAGMRKLRYYTGPSRTWFSYQRSLATGAGMIADTVSRLPPTKENARYLWKLVERIDDKLANGIDDSDGHVGACIMALIDQLAAYEKNQPDLKPLISRFCDKATNFDFEHELRAKLG
jgi:hypothetical protein